MTSAQKFTAEQIKELLGPPRLIRGESEEAYRKLWLAFVAEHNPQSLSDWLAVDQLAMKQWEQERLRRCNPALVEGILAQALRNLLLPHMTISDFNYRPRDIARDYYGREQSSRRRAEKRVADCGITNEHILAEAVQLRAKEMVILDRMDKHRASATLMLQKELDRRSEARRSQSEAPDSAGLEPSKSST